MQYRTYGKTGKIVSVLGFGGMRFEDPNNLEKSVRTVLHAFEKGITYFDTAPNYFKDKSEVIMGHAAVEMKKTGKPFYISTKSKKSNGAKLRHDLEVSLKRLNVDVIDFFNCWCVLTMEDWENRKKGGAVKEILKAKEEGLINHAVFSTHLPGHEIRKVIEEKYFEGVTLGYSAINFPYREQGIICASKHNIGVVVMNPLGGGIIVNNEKAFNFIKVRPKQTMLEAALHFLLANKKITIALMGFRNKKDVDTACEALDSYIPYTPPQTQAIKERVKGDFNSLCTTCMYCNVCPSGIPVWKFMETYNHLILRGGDTVANRLTWHWGLSIKELDKCTECGKCEKACTQHLPILKCFKELKKAWANKLAMK